MATKFWLKAHYTESDHIIERVEAAWVGSLTDTAMLPSNLMRNTGMTRFFLQTGNIVQIGELVVEILSCEQDGDVFRVRYISGPVREDEDQSNMA